MSRQKEKVMFDFNWNVDKYKSNYDSDYWDLCRTFMITHKTKYPEQKLVHLTEAFFQMGVYGSSYDPKTTRMVCALSVDVLDGFLELHPGALKHPFKKSSVIAPPAVTNDSSTKKLDTRKSNQQSGSIWDVAVDTSIIVNVLIQPQLKILLRGFIIIYDVRQASTMNDNKVSILEESFKRSKFGPCHWDKDDTHNNICPLQMYLKWKGTVIAEAMGSDEKILKTRLAQAVLSKIAIFSSGIEAKWSYYRDGRVPDHFERPNPRKSNIYRVMPRSQFKAMAEIMSFVDTFANSDSFAEIVFGMDFSNIERNQIMEYIKKTWSTRLTYRTITKQRAQNKVDTTHLCMYQIRSGDEIRRWLDQYEGENERYRLVPPGQHRRAGACDSNVREELINETVDLTEETSQDNEKSLHVKTNDVKSSTKSSYENRGTKSKEDVKPEKKTNVMSIDKEAHKVSSKEDQGDEDFDETEVNLDKLLKGFVLFYDAKKNSEINKDDWFSALCDSFKMSKFGPLEVIIEDVPPMRTRCIIKWKHLTLASAEGLTETQAKTAATLQVITKLESFTYIIQAKEDYFYGGKIPPFLENPDPSKSDIYRIVRRKDLPSYYSIFQTLDEFVKKPPYTEIIFGADFTWELKNEIVVYIKAKALDYRYFTIGDQKPWTHMAIYHTIKPELLKDHLLKNGGENAKYKLIPPQKTETNSAKPSEVDKSKGNIKKSPPPNKRKRPEKEIPIEDEGNKIQIKLKNFKKDKVEYPEDTGGDFPGLIIFIGVKKNSMWQRNLFCILIDSFKMSKYGELVIEESEESVWGRKEPLKKCVIKSNRKVLAVGLGESKNTAKNSASLQVLRKIRKHCYTIQAKESYFKEGKATPYDFTPDPTKENVYKVAKRNKFKDRADITKYVDQYAKKYCPEEVIFGDDFTYDEREHVMQHCRQINMNYRLIKCQSSVKAMHTHVAIYHQTPLPAIKAELMKNGGETDMFRLIPPKGKITLQSSDNEMWPDTLEDGDKENVQKSIPTNTYSSAGVPAVKEKIVINPKNLSSIPPNSTLELNFDRLGSAIDNFQPAIHLVNNTQPNSHIIQSVPIQEVPFGPQPLHVPVAHFQDAPLAFGPQPLNTMYMQPQPMMVEPMTHLVGNNVAPGVEGDLREELARKRKAENLSKRDRIVYDVSVDRKIAQKKDDSDEWSRKVFVADSDNKSTNRDVKEKNDDLRDKLRHKDSTRVRRGSEERDHRMMSPDKNRRRVTPDRGRRRISPGRDRRRTPTRDRRSRDLSRERFRSREERSFRDDSPDRRVSQRWRSKSPRRSPEPYRDDAKFRRLPSPTIHFRDLWSNVPGRFSESVFMYKYVKQNSTTESDPYSLLQATCCLSFNIDFEFYKDQVAIDEWRVSVDLVADSTDLHPLVGEGRAVSEEEARLIAAYHAVDTIQKSCRVIEPNFRYFADGGIPEFIERKSPLKTPMYEIIQNLDPTSPLDRATVECMFTMFMTSEVEDLFFLASDFTYMERVLVYDVANNMNLWWRLFGPRHPDAAPDDIVSTQHLCVFKQKSGLQLARELLNNGGSSEKYTLVDPRENRITQPSERLRRGLIR